MTIQIFAHSNQDDVLIAWQPQPWDEAYIGFTLERRDAKTQDITVLNNRVPPTQGAGPVPAAGISSQTSPFRRCMWIDHEPGDTDEVEYRVTPVIADGAGFKAADGMASDWTAPLRLAADAGGGMEVSFNRGTIMSQVVSRFLNNDITPQSLKGFVAQLADPGFAPRRYLSGDIRHNLLDFLSSADQAGNHVYAAIYEFKDEELIAAVKAFKQRAHVLLGNGGTTKAGLLDELKAAGIDAYHRDLSNGRGSSPSVHNKFVVETKPDGTPLRVLTGSTNWTTTGLCTQLNNLLVLSRPEIARRFLEQWHALVAAGDKMTPKLREDNGVVTVDDAVSLYFAATKGEAEFAPVLDLIAKAKQGILFLMFMPGKSPLLEAVLKRDTEGMYIRGVVSTETTDAKGDIKVDHDVISTGGKGAQSTDVILPEGVPDSNRPDWALGEAARSMFLHAGMNAIVHSKVLVIDPFLDSCAVVTGSHNFSDSASAHNDENLVIIQGNKELAMKYAVHIQGAHDHYSWRAFLQDGGDPTRIYKSLDGWRPGGDKFDEIKFWLR